MVCHITLSTNERVQIEVRKLCCKVGLFFSGEKTGDVKAPADADKGVLGTGAIDWLQLGDNGRGLSRDVALVYRVVTAGGVAQACSVSGANDPGQALSVPYTAQYWFYSA
ncbi:hypothetical protein F5883DRAFT_686948 [Diaporthe sp. PMI_573]|nr:hypothetical protein F5883DRAFT_686948 [Diaporthaceae sp. PMI_573]